MGIVHTVSLFPGVFFSESFGRTDTDRGYQYNLVPFKEITRYFRHYDVLGPTLFMINMIGNVAAFMPFGFFLPIISRRSKKWYNTVMFGFVFSLMLETLNTGAYGFSSLAAALMGLWYGARSFMEKDRNYILAKIGISISVVLVIVWAVIIITGIVR